MFAFLLTSLHHVSVAAQLYTKYNEDNQDSKGEGCEWQLLKHVTKNDWNM